MHARRKTVFRRSAAPIVASLMMMFLVVIASIGVYYFVRHGTGLVKETRVGGKSFEKIVFDKVLWKGVGIAYVRGISRHGYSIYLSRDGESWGRATVLREEIVPRGISKIIFSTGGLSPGDYWVMIKSPTGGTARAKFKVGGQVLFETRGFGWDLFYAAAEDGLYQLSGYTYRIYDIRGMPTLPRPEEIIGLGNNHLLSKGAVEKIDFTDNPHYLGTRWPQSQTDRFAGVFNTTLVLPVDFVCSFKFVVDDALALYIDGSQVFSSWKLQAPTHYTYTTDLSRGFHRVAIVYVENTGTARLGVDMECSPRSTSSYDVLYIKGYYYDTSSDTPTHPDPAKVESGDYTLILRRDENRIDYDDHGGNPWPISQTDKFAAKYTVLLQVNREGYYTFHAESDDGIIVKLNGTTIISDWSLHGTRTYTKEVLLHQGIYEVTILYYENTGVARLYFNIKFAREAGVQELTPSYKAYVYDISSWTNWGHLKALEENVLSGNFPLIGEYSVPYINYTDRSGYGGEPWFFRGPGNIDNFAVVFNATLTTGKPGELQAITYSDDGVRVYIDGDVMLDDWSLHAPKTSRSETILYPGSHQIEIVYFEHTGISRLKVDLFLRPLNVYYYPTKGDVLYIRDPQGYLRGHTLLVIGENGSLLADTKITNSGLIEVRLNKKEDTRIHLVVIS